MFQSKTKHVVTSCGSNPPFSKSCCLAFPVTVRRCFLDLSVHASPAAASNPKHDLAMPCSTNEKHIRLHTSHKAQLGMTAPLRRHAVVTQFIAQSSILFNTNRNRNKLHSRKRNQVQHLEPEHHRYDKNPPTGYEPSLQFSASHKMQVQSDCKSFHK